MLMQSFVAIKRISSTSASPFRSDQPEQLVELVRIVPLTVVPIVPLAVIPLLSALAVVHHLALPVVHHRAPHLVPHPDRLPGRVFAHRPIHQPGFRRLNRELRDSRECPGSRDSRLLQYAALSADKAWLSELYDAGREPEKRFMDVVRIQSAMEPAKGGACG